MIRIFLALLFLQTLWGDAVSYKVTSHPYSFSTYFEMDSPQGYVGKVIAHRLSLRDCYDLYDARGKYLARGLSEFFSLGLFSSALKNFCLYDERGVQFGYIDGEILSTSSGKYSFYDAAGNKVAAAYIDRVCNGCTLLSYPEERTIAQYKRIYVLDAPDSWEVTLYDRYTVDLRMIGIFSAFLVDYQGDFREDR